VVRRVAFISGGMLYIILRVHWCNIIVLKSDYMWTSSL
jgi:hypothetical protein